ncbi:aminotransferase class IV, partial [Pelomonas sp. KK5]|uniref:aminotransferase class IV n=1 Tax=Pelomonas sp. KK5 TaxID=1855730 RepID=UPI0018E96B7A
DGHLARLQRTARHFGIKLQPGAVRDALELLALQRPADNFRVRLTVSAGGEIATQCVPLPATPGTVKLALAHAPIDTEGPAAEFLQHKTTRREIYQPFVDAKPAGAFDVILFNRAGELTECSFGNLAVRLDGWWITPPAACGLLPGVLREELLQQGKLRSGRIRVEDLQRAEGLAFINSLRGWLDAELLG